MKTTHRAVAGILLISLLSGLSSCGVSQEQVETTKTTAAADTAQPEITIAPNSVESLEKQDFGGREFRIAVNDKYTTEMWVESVTGDVCNDAVYERNSIIDDYFNTKIAVVVTPYVNNDSHINKVQSTILAGEDAFDLTAVYTYLAGGPALQGCYINWKDVPGVDFSAPWWIQSANESYTIGGNQYVAVGDLSITTLLLSYAVFFNRNLAADYQLGDLYAEVLEGTWTIDRLIECTKDIYQDLNGNEKIDMDDIVGFAADAVTNLDAYHAAFDLPITERDEAGNPVCCLNIERMQTAVEKVCSLYHEQQSFIAAKAGDEITMFANCHTAFLTTWLNNAFTSFRDMEDDYGILPYPKLEETQADYYSFAMDNFSLLSVPRTVTDVAFVGILTEAMTRESNRIVVPAYYDVALTDKYARDEQSVAMLDIIMDGRCYDFAMLHGSKLSNIPYFFRELVSANRTNVASGFASKESTIEKGLQSLVEQYAELAK